MKLFRTLRENIQAAGTEDWFWWLLIVPALVIAALISHSNGTLPDYLWNIFKGVMYVLAAIPIMLLMGYCFVKLTKRHK